MSEWTTVQPMLVERAERCINNDPSVLLEQEGGPVGATADVILARLYGFDEQVDHDWRIRSVAPVLLAPIVEPLALVESPVTYSPLRTAEYHLQSNYAEMRMDARYSPPDVTLGPDFMFRILFVRYRRN